MVARMPLQGVIWSRVGEVSLVGGLGCGGFLLQLALEEMEATGAHDYAVVQATESSAGFYDRMGFVRVGALARYVAPGSDYRKAETVAYRHFAGPDEDISMHDSSIMMAIRLRPGAIPRRVLLKHGGIYSNLGCRVSVCLEHAGELDLSVKSTAPSSPEDVAGAVIAHCRAGEEEQQGKECTPVLGPCTLIGTASLIGPDASAQLLTVLKQVIGRPEFQLHSLGKEGKEEEGGREGRRASEFARRRLSLWLSPKESNKSWQLYGTPALVVGSESAGRCSGGGAPRGGRGRGRGRPPGNSRKGGVVRQRVALGGATYADSPGGLSVQETPRMERKRKSSNGGPGGGGGEVALRLMECIKKETLRVVCADFSLQISGPKNMLMSRVEEAQRELEQGPEGAGRWWRGWLDTVDLKLTTLELICVDLGIYKRGTKDDLRLRIFEFALGHYAAEDDGVMQAHGSIRDMCLSPGGDEAWPGGSGEFMSGERKSLEPLRKDTLRLVCFDLEVPFSGPKHVLIPRLLRSCQAVRAESGVAAGDVSGWWLFMEGVKQSTLQCACVDLGLSKQGAKPLLRRRVLAHVGDDIELEGKEEEDQEQEQDGEKEEEGEEEGEEDQEVVVGSAGVVTDGGGQKKARGRPRKIRPTEVEGHGGCTDYAPAASCKHAHAHTGKHACAHTGAADLWDAVEVSLFFWCLSVFLFV